MQGRPALDRSLSLFLFRLQALQALTGANVDASEVPYFYVGGLAADASGNLYVTNGPGTRKISAGGGTTLLDGVASLDSPDGVSSRTFARRGIAVDSAGTVWIANSDATISTIDASGRRTQVAGLPDGPGYADGSGPAARFSQVTAMTPDGAGNVFAADSGNSVIRKITPAGVVTSVAGVAADGKGTLYTISGNAVIKITLP